MDDKKVLKKKALKEKANPQVSEEADDFEEVEEGSEDEGSKQEEGTDEAGSEEEDPGEEVEFEEDEETEEGPGTEEAEAKGTTEGQPSADPKNPLGLKRDSSKPIPIRRPPPMAGKIPKGTADDATRSEQIRKDRLEAARRYESLRLYDEALKYYKLACDETEITRIEKIMNDLYIAKAKEFEAQGRFEEAANLYDILKLKDNAQSCRTKGGVAIPPLNLEEGGATAISAFRAPNNPAMLVNPQKSPYIAAGQEEAAKEAAPMPLKKPKDAQKAFSVCPYCGEEINLPKPPKFCPYCREAFQ